MAFYPILDHAHERPWRTASEAVTVPLGSAATVILTWPTPMPDVDYTPLASIEGADLGSGLVVRRVLAHTATGVEVRVENTNALGAASGTVHGAAIPAGGA